MKKVRNAYNVAEPKDSKRDSELKAINQILDRRYEVLIELS